MHGASQVALLQAQRLKCGFDRFLIRLELAQIVLSLVSSRHGGPLSVLQFKPAFVKGGDRSLVHGAEGACSPAQGLDGVVWRCRLRLRELLTCAVDRIRDLAK